MKLPLAEKLMKVLIGAMVACAVLAHCVQATAGVLLVVTIILLLAVLVVYFVFLRCPACGRLLGRDRGEFCPHCGAKLREE